jgi:hypothetical protein
MVTNGFTDSAASYGELYNRNTGSGLSASADIVAVAIANKTINTATQAMHQQFDRFLEVFA